MKRFHVPSVKSPSERISKVCDRAFYYEGSYKYKLPRFYRDRLYRQKFPCETRVWNQKNKCYETKIVYRYQSKNLLSLQMQNEVRNRVLAEYNQSFQEFKLGHPNKSDTEIHIELERSRVRSKMARRQDIYSKMSRFYNSNRFKNRKF